MKRNWHSLNNITTREFGHDKTNWCKYEAFFDMYDSIEKALIEEEFIIMLEEPEWQDKDGNHVEFESDEFGCKVDSRFSRPDMVLLGD